MKISEREKEVLTGAVDILAKSFSPARIFLFGSRAKGEASSGADFDLAVDAKRPDFSAEVKIKAEIRSIAGLYSIDIVFLPSLDKEFAELILKTGKLVYEKRRGKVFD